MASAATTTPSDSAQSEQQVGHENEKDRYVGIFNKSTKEFDAKCKAIQHQICHVCHVVSMQDIFKTGKNLCVSCAKGNKWCQSYTDMLPVWFDENNVAQFHVPQELSCLREGEKLLIQQISVYVPLHHLKYGQLGARGHIVSFPQDITNVVCKQLPRTPSNIDFIRVVKRFKLSDGELKSTTFMIRKKQVLDALKWLKKFNTHYRDIEILEENMSWIEDGIEQQLPPTISEETREESFLHITDEDRGPSEAQICNITDGQDTMETSYGTLSEFNSHMPKTKDTNVIDTIVEAEKSGLKITAGSKRKTLHFPYVSPTPVCEFTEKYLFEKAFPCLFPGGQGGYHSIPNPMPPMAEWLVKTILFKDGRFAKDKMWAFCALNFFARHTNQTSGGFFVKSFFKKGPKTLEALKEQVEKGELSWLNSISYFSQRVTGSTAYWRARRDEVFAWINYHIEQKHGPPTFFITLSCAEYHWPDIERLIVDRCEKGGMAPPDLTKSRIALVNEYTIVVQEYYQYRVQAWLDTVGKDLLRIKHHWLRFEFAESRGQIHVHMLAICDNMDMLIKCHELKDDKPQLAIYLSKWMEETLGMSATLNENDMDQLQNIPDIPHPAMVSYSDIPEENANLDIANCQVKFQCHKCSAFCMRKRQHTKKNETPEQKKRRVCRCGAGVEKTYMKCDTPGFIKRQVPVILRDLRGFDRVDLQRNNQTIVQSSTFLMRGWRGNCDIQLLIYKSKPDDVDPKDVSRVTNYVVSYACKGSESSVQEKKAMASMILRSEEDEGDVRDVNRLARKILNESSRNRVISKQEALCQLSGLALYTCSETMEHVSLAGNTRLGTEFQAKNTFLSRYAMRDKKYKHMSLNQYFHFVNNTDTSENRNKRKVKIPIYTGARCEAVFPANEAYARGVMLIYAPWEEVFELDKSEHLLQKFEEFISDKTRCPESVSVSYERAKLAISMREPTTRANETDYENFCEKPDEEIMELVALAGTIYSDYDETKDNGMSYDYGIETDWSQRSVDVSAPNS